MIKKLFKNLPKRLVALTLALVLGYTTCNEIINAFAEGTSYGEGDYCLSTELEFENGFSMSNISSVKVNGDPWASTEDRFSNSPDENNVLWTVEIIAGMNGDLYPQILTPGGSDSYLTYTAVPNPGDTDAPDDDFILTLIYNDNWDGKGDADHCGFASVRITEGPPIEEPQNITNVTSNVSITISGDELEYHYDSEHLDEADVTYFKFDINGGTEENHLVPFTFRNAQYTYNDGEPPRNVSSVTTKEPIQYVYPYDGSGKVNFCVNGGGTDEYTHIYINGIDYASQAPHSKVEHFESMNGWAQMFCIQDVPYSENYVVSVTGETTSVENRIPGFGWSYLSADRSDIDPSEEGNFAHGKLEFVSATYTVDQNETITINDVNDFNNYRYHGTGQIFQWNDGNKSYPEANRHEAWGEAQLPYGTTLTVRIVPDEGYQLTNLASNPNGFQATDTPGVYTITLNNSNFDYDNDKNIFDLNPEFTEVGAEVITGSVNVKSGNIETNQAVENGTLKLEINDTASMSPERVESFEALAEQEGYDIENYLDISLYNAIYKGGKKDDNDNYLSWDTEVNNLDENARITLELEQNMEGKEVILIHEKRDGSNFEYEVVPANYNAETNSIEFETNSFSEYAVAYKDADPGENPPAQPETVTVEFNSNGGTEIPPVEIDKGSVVQRPEDPENGDMIFDGWFEDPTLEARFDFGTPVDGDLILYAKWNEPEQPGPEPGDEPGEEPVRDTRYTKSDSNDNSISFMEEAGHSFTFVMFDYLTLSDAELEANNIPKDLYNQMLGQIRNIVDDYGEFLYFYEIAVVDENDNEIHQGPFNIRIKMTDEMKKYDTIKIMFIDTDNNFVNEDPITLTKDGDYLVGTLNHLSRYALIGTNTTSNPVTNDSVMVWYTLATISIVGMAVCIVLTKKKKVK